MSQCDEQTFGSTFKFKEAGIARDPLAKSSKQVSMKMDKAPCEPTTILWHNKKANLQCKSQNLEPVTFENLVVHFDQGKFEELLSGGGSMLRARKHGKVSMVRFRSRNQKQNPSNTSQPRVWLVRFPANLSLLFQSRRLCMKLQA